MDAVKESIHIYFMQAIAKVSCFKSEILLQVTMYLFKHFRIKSSHFVTIVWLSNEINKYYVPIPRTPPISTLTNQDISLG